MEKRRLGRTDIEFSALTFGCWQAGKAEWQGVEDQETIAAMRAALDLGINAFDTAEAYGGGYSETIVAQALEGRRDEAVIATKVGAGNLAHDKVLAACEGSLKNLNTDRIDLYQVHWPSGSWGSPIVPIEETMTALAKLKQQGKIRAIGVSNFNAQQIEEALQFERIESLQPPYSLFWDVFERNGTFAACVKHDISILPYSPMAQGLLTGKFSRENRPTDDNRSRNILFQDPFFDVALDAIDQLKAIAQKYSADTAQLSLAWLLAQPGVASVIVGARNSEQIIGTSKAASLQIEQSDLDEIKRIGQTVTRQLPEDKTNMWG
jgi:myo-inositol catabolism protein IolS